MIEPAPPYPDNPHADEISNRQRRSLRRTPDAVLRAEASQAQQEAGLRIRIWRPVQNSKDFRTQMNQWHAPSQEGNARYIRPAQLSMTIFDTNQRPLRACDEYTEESLRDKLRDRYPQIFLQLGPVAVRGVELFGHNSFVALAFEPGEIYEQPREVQKIVAPELSLDDSYHLDFKPHVSLGKILVDGKAEAIRSRVAPHAPSQVSFGPAKVDITKLELPRI